MNMQSAQEATRGNVLAVTTIGSSGHACLREPSGSLPAVTLESVEGGVLDPSLGRVVIRIAPYPEMACGDRVVLSWHGLDIEGLLYRHEFARSISETQLGRDIVFVIRSPHIAALDGGSLEVFWTLSSMKWLLPVNSVRTQLNVGDVLYSLLPPTVDDAVGGHLDPARVNEGTTVILQPYAGMSVGDRVELFWQGAAELASFRDSLIVESFAVGAPLVFGVDSRFIIPHPGSEVLVRYVIEQKNGALRESGSRNITIAPLVRGVLAAPQVLEAREGALDVRETIDGVSIVISNAQVEVGELVYLKCDGEHFFHRDDREITSGMEIEPLVFIVPYRFWREHVGTAVRVSYSIERLDDVSQVSDVALLRVLA
ncbi:hypothetical protein [Pseudomonas sp. COW5]|uniref:hypothetical protein n=1 Tax=Pseudomonas sp. COW5 TaxID=2981253 RepID=UPI00224658B6|nr:hypothetical protein [Pseudomonas sp. COW5]MCX2546118.1 hypothetical protein [Pseudomonas sp. COW5]